MVTKVKLHHHESADSTTNDKYFFCSEENIIVIASSIKKISIQLSYTLTWLQSWNHKSTSDI